MKRLCIVFVFVVFVGCDFHGGGDDVGAGAVVCATATSGTTELRARYCGPLDHDPPSCYCFEVSTVKSDWRHIGSSPMDSVSIEPTAQNFRIVDDRHLAIFFAMQVWVSDDAGDSWFEFRFDEMFPFASGGVITELDWSQDGRGEVVIVYRSEMREDQMTVVTNDAGGTWKVLEEVTKWDEIDLDVVCSIVGPPVLIRAVYLPKGDAKWLQAFSGELFVSRSSGATWRQVGKPPVFNSFCFLDSATGWGSNWRGVWQTEDGGHTWEFLHSGQGLRVRDMHFVSRSIGWVITAFAIYQTQDGGRSWVEQFRAVREGSRFLELCEAEFVDENTVIILTDEDRICRTDDGGASWKVDRVSTGSRFDGYFEAAHMEKDGVYWLVGGYAVATKSIDKGRTWTKSVVSSNFIIASIFFVDDEYGWASGCVPSDTRTFHDSRPAVVRTTNGGKSWTKQNVSSIQNGVTRIVFDDRLHGMAATDLAVYSTVDGGARWTLALDGRSLPNELDRE